MKSLPTIVINNKEYYRFQAENTEVLFKKAFGAGSVEAAILAQLYAMAVTHKVNLSTLVPVLEGIIELWRTDCNGKVVVNFGRSIDERTGRKGKRYCNVELRRVMETNKPLS